MEWVWILVTVIAIVYCALKHAEVNHLAWGIEQKEHTIMQLEDEIKGLKGVVRAYERKDEDAGIRDQSDGAVPDNSEYTSDSGELPNSNDP